MIGFRKPSVLQSWHISLNSSENFSPMLLLIGLSMITNEGRLFSNASNKTMLVYIQPNLSYYVHNWKTSNITISIFSSSNLIGCGENDWQYSFDGHINKYFGRKTEQQLFCNIWKKNIAKSIHFISSFLGMR